MPAKARDGVFSLRGDTLHASVVLYPAYVVDSVSVRIVQPCGGGAALNTAYATEYTHDSLVADLPLTCLGTVWVRADVWLNNRTMHSDSVRLSVGDSTSLGGLSYTSNPAVYVLGSTVTPNTPHVNGHATRYKITPRLPDSLAFDTATGIVSGKPVVVLPATLFRVTVFSLNDSDTVALSIRIMDTATVRVSTLHWKRDTLNLSVLEGETIYYVLRDSLNYTGTASLSYTALPGLPVGDTVISTSALYHLTPSYTDSGTYNARVRVTDGALSDTVTLRVHVANVNRAPAFAAGAPEATVAVDENATLSMRVKAIDADGDAVHLFVDSCGLPRCAGDSLRDTTFRWHSLMGDAGLYRMVFGATDGHDTSYAGVSVGVGAVNLPPSISIAGHVAGDNIAAKEGSTLTLRLSLSDLNAGQHPRFVASVRNAPAGSSFNADSGIFTYTPGFDVSTRAHATVFDSVTFRAVDDGTPPESAQVLIRITVVDSNRAPTVSSVGPGNGVVVSVNALKLTWSGADLDGDSLIYQVYLGTLSDQLEVVATTSDTSYRLSSAPIEGMTYYWRIVGSDELTSATSITRSFKVNSVPTVTLSAPPDNAVDNTIPVRLAWSGTDGDAADAANLIYSVYIASRSGAFQRVAYDTTVTSCMVRNLSYTSIYRWKVMVSDGKDSATSAERTFTTGAPQAHLQALSVSGGTLVPAFNRDTLTYTVTVPAAQDTLDIIATPEDSIADTRISGTAQPGGVPRRITGLQFGANTIPVEVTAGDGATRLRYTINVVRNGRSWQKLFGSPTSDQGLGVEQCPDSGFVVCGTSTGSSLMYLVRLDKYGDTLWTRTVRNVNDGNAVVHTRDGGFAVCGSVGGNITVVTFDSLGNILQSSQICRGGGRGIVRDANGYVVSGEIYTDANDFDVVVARVSNTLTPVSVDTLSYPGPQRGKGISIAPNGCLFASSYSRIFKLSSDLSVLWGFDVMLNEYFWHAEPTTDGGCVITGNIGSELFVYRLDSLGSVVWRGAEQGAGDSQARGIVNTAQGDFAVTGMTNVGAYLCRVSADGIWGTSTFYGIPYKETATDLCQTYDGGFVIVGGISGAYGARDADVYVVKTDQGEASPNPTP